MVSLVGLALGIAAVGASGSVAMAGLKWFNTWEPKFDGSRSNKGGFDSSRRSSNSSLGNGLGTERPGRVNK